MKAEDEVITSDGGLCFKGQILILQGENEVGVGGVEGAGGNKVQTVASKQGSENCRTRIGGEQAC